MTIWPIPTSLCGKSQGVPTKKKKQKKLRGWVAGKGGQIFRLKSIRRGESRHKIQGRKRAKVIIWRKVTAVIKKGSCGALLFESRGEGCERLTAEGEVGRNGELLGGVKFGYFAFGRDE